MLEPVVDRTQGRWVEAVVTMAADAMFADEVGAAKQAKVLGNGGAGDGESAGDFAGWLVAVAKEVQDSAAGGVRESAEDGVWMGNQVVSHNA